MGSLLLSCPLKITTALSLISGCLGYPLQNIIKENAMQTMTTAKRVLFPTAQKFLDKLAAEGGPLYKLPPKEARKVLNKIQAAPIKKMPADIEDRTIPGGPEGEVSIRIVRPKGSTGMLPPVLYIHGGGWVLGNMDTHDRLIREIANGAQAPSFFVIILLPHEAHYPIANRRSLCRYKMGGRKGKEINNRYFRLVVAGDSVGGNMTAAVTLFS